MHTHNDNVFLNCTNMNIGHIIISPWFIVDSYHPPFSQISLFVCSGIAFVFRRKMSSQRTRHDLTLAEKVKLLKEYDKLEKMSQTAAAGKLGIAQSVLSKLLKSRYEIETSFLSNETSSRKRKRDGKDPEVEQALKKWFAAVRESDCRVDGPILKQKAEDFAEKLGHTNFSATDGWFSRWKKRENMVWSSLKGEAGEADVVAADAWLREVWPTIIEEYSPDDIFNADETGLYYRALPEHTYIFKADSAKIKGVKICKERLTVLCCASMAGKREQLLVIGKSKCPRCFKGVKKLPVDYHANSNAWMTILIFSEWLQKWDKRLTRKIILLVDNCTAHSVTCTLKNIRLIYLPANTTSLLQPCDQGIIKTLKGYYRYNMRRQIIQLVDQKIEKGECGLKANDLAKKTTVLDAMHFLASAWKNSVTEETVINCFRKGGFKPADKTNDDHSQKEPTPFPDPNDIDLDMDEFEEWLNIDENVQTMATTTEEEIVAEIQHQGDEKEKSDDDDDDDDETLSAPPSMREMTNALEVLKRGIRYYVDDVHEFNVQYDYENLITKIVSRNKVQTKIGDYFQKA